MVQLNFIPERNPAESIFRLPLGLWGNPPAASVAVISTPCTRMVFKQSRFPFDATTWNLKKERNSWFVQKNGNIGQESQQLYKGSVTGASSGRHPKLRVLQILLQGTRLLSWETIIIYLDQWTRWKYQWGFSFSLIFKPGKSKSLNTDLHLEVKIAGDFPVPASWIPA